MPINIGLRGSLWWATVYLRLVPYQLQSLASHANHKLHPRFYGPYELIERIGPIAYKLKLPPISKIHLVLHISCLKKGLGSLVQPSTALPKVTDKMQDPPLAIFARRMYKKGVVARVQLLVHWAGQKRLMLLGKSMKSSIPDV